MISRPSTWPRRFWATTSPIPQLYNLSDQQLEAVKKKLLELKPNIRKMWATGGELTNLFQNHEVVAGHGLAAHDQSSCKKQLSRSAKRSRKKTPRAGSTT